MLAHITSLSPNQSACLYLLRLRELAGCVELETFREYLLLTGGVWLSKSRPESELTEKIDYVPLNKDVEFRFTVTFAGENLRRVHKACLTLTANTVKKVMERVKEGDAASALSELSKHFTFS